MKDILRIAVVTVPGLPIVARPLINSNEFAFSLTIPAEVIRHAQSGAAA